MTERPWSSGHLFLCRVASLSPVFVGDWGLGRIAGCLLVVALALLSAVVKKGDAYLFSPPRRVQRWGSLVEQPLPASSLNRNSRNSPFVQVVVKETKRPGLLGRPHCKGMAIVKTDLEMVFNAGFAPYLT